MLDEVGPPGISALSEVLAEPVGASAIAATTAPLTAAAVSLERRQNIPELYVASLLSAHRRVFIRVVVAVHDLGLECCSPALGGGREGVDMSENIIEVGEDVEVDIVVDEDGNVVAAVIDDVVVATGAEGSIVDETIDVLDADGNVVLEDETVSVYDADGNLVAEAEEITVV